MQDPYTADVGDFGKLGLLRHLFCNGGGWKLGVVWYLCPPTIGSKDGGHVGYCKNPEYADCDPELSKHLATLIDEERRTVADIERCKLLGINAVYFSDLLCFDEMPVYSEVHRAARCEHRRQWLARALEKTRSCNAIFLDPDNGIEIKSTARHARKGPKFAFLDEIAAFASEERVVVVYHHLNRHRNHGSHEQQMRDRAKQLKEHVGNNGKVFSLRFRPYSPRAFFILTTAKTESQISSRLVEFMATPWNRYFEHFA
jgi:hypothetical protein